MNDGRMEGKTGGGGGQDNNGGGSKSREEVGEGKEEAMTHISDPDPSGLLLTLVTPSRECVCATSDAV